MYIVGAGCGDFDLITMRGAEYIRHCDVLVYDSLIDYCAIIGLNQKDLENQGILA